ncbi:MAG TPA: Na+/H+ antiporter, partial [Candidatus Baltobacteraceae bacterium]|nr:Na+/H+ antiporter [Candidatus Baltobacteraceae bacterium]
LVLMTSVVACAVVAKRFSLPYPIAFVIGGALLALVPGSPSFNLNPDWVLFIFLPPLLFAGGWFTDWKLFRQNARPIGLLAIGLVIFTTVGVALVAHRLIPGLSWPAAFALGAIVSPPDAVAAGAVFERFSVPQRIMSILDGEGLVNDATALVIYRFAVAAVLTGAFSAAQAGAAFVVVAVGGIAVGLGFAFVYSEVVKFLRRAELADYQLDNVLSLIAPYAAYLAAEALHVSGVLSTVTAGIVASRMSSKLFNSESRLVAYSVWSLLIFLLNGLVFLLIGLELRVIVRDPSFALRELWIGLVISLLVIVLRIVWVFPATYVPRLIWKRINEVEGVPSWKYVFIIAWSGMRGVVSLAAALALPLRDTAGNPFPGRNAILFVTFCVIFATLVFQGLSLIPIIKWLGIHGEDDLEKRENEVRVAALKAGLARLHGLEPFDSTTEWEVEGRILAEYEYRIAHLEGHARMDGSNAETVEINLDHRLQTEALDAERAEILRLRAAGEIPDEIYRKIEYDLDLASERLN